MNVNRKKNQGETFHTHIVVDNSETVRVEMPEKLSLNNR